MVSTDMVLDELLARVRVLEDKSQLASLMNRYCIAADARDRVTQGECFTEDISFHTAWGVFRGRAEIAKMSDEQRHIGETAMQHSMTNYEFSVDGDSATGTGSLFFAGTLDTSRPLEHRSRGGHYAWEFRRGGEFGWQISKLVVQILWEGRSGGVLW
jgi:ketosteroid isomerase-like protein